MRLILCNTIKNNVNPNNIKCRRISNKALSDKINNPVMCDIRKQIIQNQPAMKY